MPFGYVNKVEGSPVGTDAAPNTTAPSEARISKSPLLDGQKGGSSSALLMLLFALGGTTATVNVWARDPILDRWFLVNTGGVVTVTADELAQVTGVPADADVFVQVVANAGSVTTLAFCWA